MSACPILSTSMSDNLSQQEICAMFTKDKNGCIFKLKAVLSMLKRMKQNLFKEIRGSTYIFKAPPNAILDIPSEALLDNSIELPSVIFYGK